MDGETHGDEAAQVELAEGQEDAQAQGEVTGSGGGHDGAAGGKADDGYEALLAKRDERIAELEAQVAEAAAADERVEYELRLAGARSVTAVKALLAEHGGDVAALKEAEPWMFLAGATGLPNAGAASDQGRTLRRWERIAGLDGDDE